MKKLIAMMAVVLAASNANAFDLAKMANKVQSAADKASAKIEEAQAKNDAKSTEAQAKIEDKIAEQFLEGRIDRNSTIIISARDGDLSFKITLPEN